MPRPRSKKIDELALALAKCSVFSRIGHGNWSSLEDHWPPEEFSENKEYFRAAAARLLRRLNDIKK